jgi:hypothetical protein
MKSLVALVSLALMLASPVLAQNAEVMTVAGTTAAVAVEAGKLTVQVTKSPDAPKVEAGNNVTFSVDDRTEIMKDGKPIELGEIKVGDAVSVNYEESGGGYMALSIGVKSQAAW